VPPWRLELDRRRGGTGKEYPQGSDRGRGGGLQSFFI